LPRLENFLSTNMVTGARRTNLERRTGDAVVTESAAAAADAKLEEFAEDLGRLLRRAQITAEGWIGQRNAIAEHLMGVRDRATKLLAQLGIGDAPARPKRGRKPASRNMPPAPRQEIVKRGPGLVTGSGKNERTMSAEALQKIAVRQRARCAKWKKAAT
jgi:hypothetical protein